MMRATLGLGFVCGVLLVFACAPDGPVDGGPCEHDEQCPSRRCEPEGYCRGRSCDADGDCDPGWGCKAHHYSGSDFIFGLGATEPSTSHFCEPRCGSCPDNFSCFVEEAEYCAFDPEWGTPEVTVTVPEAAAVGERVVLAATASSPVGLEIVGYTWSFGDGTKLAGARVERVLTEFDADSSSFEVALEVVDEDDHRFHDLWSIQVCVATGAECGYYSYCCGGGSCSGDPGTCP